MLGCEICENKMAAESKMAANNPQNGYFGYIYLTKMNTVMSGTDMMY